MRLIRRPGTTRHRPPQGCVATIGVFDGVHQGHQLILRRVIDEAKKRGLPSLVFSFEPTPQEYFSKSSPPARLMQLREKYQALEALGINWLYCPPFDETIESLDPLPFIRQFLVETLGVKHLVVGDDFRFAKGRSGTMEDLITAGRDEGFGVEQTGSVIQDGIRVSSTAIRAALDAGELEQAKNLLGRYYRMSGRIVAGKKLGKTLGFPTANVNLNRVLSPVMGIFAVRIDGLEEGLLDGVASVGTRPTVGGTVPILEVYIFDFDREIYGQHIQVEFVARLRDEVHFPDLESLRQQMHIDADQARQILANLQ